MTLTIVLVLYIAYKIFLLVNFRPVPFIWFILPHTHPNVVATSEIKQKEMIRKQNIENTTFLNKIDIKVHRFSLLQFSQMK